MFKMADADVEAICFLRAKCVHLRERREFYIEQGHVVLAEAMGELADRIPEIISLTISAGIIDRFGHENKLGEPSELYDDCRTLGAAIARFCREWGTGQDPDLIESIFDLEEEINICYGVET